MSPADHPDGNGFGRRTSPPPAGASGDGYRWIALSNTSLGVFMAFANSNIVLIAMPAIFNGIHVDPLAPAETNYFLWLLFGYLVVTSVLLVTFGRISDMFGRVRLYNAGFAVFTLGSILLMITPGSGNTAALELILFRLVQGVGAGFLFANSTAILTDAFPPHQRGLAMGLNQVSALVGSLGGLILGGILATVNWRLVFLVSVPFGLFGTVWSYWKLHETVIRRGRQRIDWIGNITFAAGLTILLVGITYGIQPYGDRAMGWTNPWVIGELALGAVLLTAFIFIEMLVPSPMFRLELFRIRAFAAGNTSNFLSSLARGGLQFMLIIWLQGIWLPLHGYAFEDTPLWAGIYMTPLLIAFAIFGPLAGWLSDLVGSRLLASLGMVVNAAGFIGLTFLPANFSYVPFAILLVVLGIGQGIFAAPNTTAIMNSLPPEHRGVGSGMRATLQNAATVISIGVFFSIVILGLSGSLAPTLAHGLEHAGLPRPNAREVAHLPPTSALFAAFLGYNPMSVLVPPATLHRLPLPRQQELLSTQFFPNLISGPFLVGLRTAFWISAAMCFIAAIASMLRGRRYIHGEDPPPEAAAGDGRMRSA